MVDFQRLRSVVEEASFLQGDERRAYLEEACSGDAELRTEAEGLLSASGRASFLDSPVRGLASAVADATTATESLPERIGPYRVVGVIGSGGMGVVLEAEEDEPRRRVAVKVLRRGLADPEAVARFRHEAQLLARLRHPAIAQVYATGVHASGDALGGDMPWFAMEYVEEARTLSTMAREESLSRDQRLQLFLRVAGAVQHGHQKGIVHRDLKPENILVDREGNPKVIDFGVALADESARGDSTRFTQAGQILGTLAYMSPEQFAESDVDTRSDVYSLGVCLYELLTDGLPLDLRDKPLAQVAALVQNEPPRRTKRLTGDLEAVVFKALEKEPGRRYGTVSAFAGDILRVLVHQPVEARSPSTTYLLRTFVRRHRTMVAAVAFVFVAALAAAGISFTYGREAQRAEQETSELFATLLERSTEMTAGFSDELVALAGGRDLGRRMIQRTIEDLEDLDERAGGGAEIRARLAKAWYRLGLFEARLEGQALESAERAFEAFDRSEELLASLLQAAPGDRELRLLLASCKLERATIHERARRLDVALASTAEGKEILVALRDDFPNDAEILIQLAYAYDGESTTLGLQGEMEALRESLAAAQELFAAAAELDPISGLHDVRQAGTLVTLGGSYWSEARYGEAAEAYAGAIELLEPAVQRNPTSLPHREMLGRALLWSGEAQFGLGDHDAARRALADSVEVYRALHADDPLDPQYEISLVHLANTLGTVEREDPDGDLERAATWFLEALDILETLEAEGRLAPAYAGFRPRVQTGLDKVEARLLDE